MTVILDPGNQAESYNSTVRQWRQSSGLWKADYGTSQSALGAMTTDRNYWKTTVAHDDPAVWDNRYNAGYAAGQPVGYNSGYAAADAAESPRALANFTFTSTFPVNNNWAACSISGSGDGAVITNNGSYLTAHRPGYYAIYQQTAGYNNVGSRVYTEGVLRSERSVTNAQDFCDGIGAYWMGFINAGGLITFMGRSTQAVGGGNIQVTFVPTPGYQQ